MALYKQSFKAIHTSEQPDNDRIVFINQAGSTQTHIFLKAETVEENPCFEITYQSIISRFGVIACNEAIIVQPPSTTSIVLTNYDGSCVFFEIQNGTFTGDLNVQYSVNSGISWISSPGSKISPRCGDIPENMGGILIRLASISTPSIVSNTYYYNGQPNIKITKIEDGCMYFDIENGTINLGLNILSSIDSGETWTSISGSSESPRCDVGIPSITTWFQLQSLDNLNNVSNIFIYEVDEQPPVEVVPKEILLVGSPHYISYSQLPLFEGILDVKLYIWSGAYTEIPATPTYNLKVNSSYVEIGDYIKDFLNPQPNSSYFTATPTNFKECINVYYEYDVWNELNENLGTVKSNLKLATLGYGLFSEGANPILNINPIDKLLTIDSTLVTIDSTQYTQDNGSNRSLFDHSKLFHKTTELIYNGLLNDNSVSSDDLVVRELTSDFIPVCGGKYKGRHIMYLNNNGFLDTFSFPFAENRKLKIKNDSYTRLISNPNKYNTFHASKVHLNKEITVEWTMNTGILNTYNVGIIEEIVNSDRHWLIDYENQAFIPLIITTSNFDEKTRENDRGKIQYTLVFEQGDYKNDMH